MRSVHIIYNRGDYDSFEPFVMFDLHDLTQIDKIENKKQRNWLE